MSTCFWFPDTTYMRCRRGGSAVWWCLRVINVRTTKIHSGHLDIKKSLNVKYRTFRITLSTEVRVSQGVWLEEVGEERGHGCIYRWAEGFYRQCWTCLEASEAGWGLGGCDARALSTWEEQRHWRLSNILLQKPKWDAMKAWMKDLTQDW